MNSSSKPGAAEVFPRKNARFTIWRGKIINGPVTNLKDSI